MRAVDGNHACCKQTHDPITHQYTHKQTKMCTPPKHKQMHSTWTALGHDLGMLTALTCDGTGTFPVGCDSTEAEGQQDTRTNKKTANNTAVSETQVMLSGSQPVAGSSTCTRAATLAACLVLLH